MPRRSGLIYRPTPASASTSLALPRTLSAPLPSRHWNVHRQLARTPSLGRSLRAAKPMCFCPPTRACWSPSWSSGIAIKARWTRSGAARLIREGQLLANLAPHPNLVRIYDLGLHEGRPFLVLEHVQGHTLEQHGLGDRPLPSRAAELVACLAEAAHAAHEQGVIHQDITPGNVIVDGRGQPRLIDFGLAWFRPPWTLSSEVERPDAGTPRFLSPEQADLRIGPVDRRTDVFGLGAVLYYLLTGQPLYNGQSWIEVVLQAAEGSYDSTALERNGVPKRLAAVCRKALSRDPNDRFRTAAELAETLRASVRRQRRARPQDLLRCFSPCSSAPA